LTRYIYTEHFKKRWGRPEAALIEGEEDLMLHFRMKRRWKSSY
jgi:hypothetical protein